jgi:hypothetical protein
MKRPRLRTLAVAGTLVGATLMFTAPKASAMPMQDFNATCQGLHGQLGIGNHYEFDADGNPAGATIVQICRWGGGRVLWNDTDISDHDY